MYDLLSLEHIIMEPWPHWVTSFCNVQTSLSLSFRILSVSNRMYPWLYLLFVPTRCVIDTCTIHWYWYMHYVIVFVFIWVCVWNALISMYECTVLVLNLNFSFIRAFCHVDIDVRIYCTCAFFSAFLKIYLLSSWFWCWSCTVLRAREFLRGIALYKSYYYVSVWSSLWFACLWWRANRFPDWWSRDSVQVQYCFTSREHKDY